MPVTVLVHKNSGRVYGHSPTGASLVGPGKAPAKYYTELTDPPLDTGLTSYEIVEIIDQDRTGRENVQGFQLHWTGTVVRLSTQEEIDGYPDLIADDADDDVTDRVVNFRDIPFLFRKLYMSIMRMLQIELFNGTNKDLNRAIRAIRELSRDMELLDDDIKAIDPTKGLPNPRRTALEAIRPFPDNVRQAQDLDVDGNVVRGDEDPPVPVVTPGFNARDLRNESIARVTKGD